MKHIKILLFLAVAGIAISATVANNGRLFEITKNIEIFVNVYKKLNAEYVDEVDPSELMRTGIDAMVHSLDPYTIYWSESQIESHRLSDENKYQGFGATTQLVDDRITVTEVYEDGPAFDAGLKAGDHIVAINGTSTSGKTEEEFNRISMGVPGTNVQLKVNRPGQKGDFSVDLKRGKADTNPVPYSGRVTDDIGYIKLDKFTAEASKSIAKAWDDMNDDGNLKGIILDLRNNGGGLLREAIAICNFFIPKDKVVVSTRSKVEKQNKIYKTSAVPKDVDIPVAILINDRSASASEIVSGVIQDYDRGVLLGQRSYGKGLVQNTGDVGYNSRMKLTISKYFIPSRRCIQAVEYDNGEPVDIPDNKRSKFKTANGRTVLDGGGVAPDVKLKPHKNSEFTQSLIDDYVIFNYVTGYVNNHQEVSEPRAFSFDDYNDFKSYVQSSSFDFKSKSEQSIEELIEKEKDSVAKGKLEKVLQDINQGQVSFLDTYKDEINKAIEQEIMGRYYYRSGQSAHRLNDDHEVREAIAVLNDPGRYKKILAN